MKRIFWGATVTIGILAAAWIAASVPSRAADQVDRVARGKYLVEGIGCSDCHTPKKMGPQGMELDTTRLLAGHPEGTLLPEAPTGQSAWAIAATGDLTAWTGPWGVSYAANLTPDQNTGLGIWTEDMFVSAIRKGRHMGVSRPILPPMPWWVFRNLTDEDLKSIFAYLRSIPPVHNRVPDPIIREETH